ncbi:MAG: universal stress protein [Bacteroidetes bacterium]|nr:universal stress protein [Bacteroidota bacterium]
MPETKNCILIPTDFSDQSFIALGQAYNLAKFLNAKIVLLHVENEQSPANAKEMLDKRAEKVSAEASIEVTTMVAKGERYAEIHKVAADLNPALIMMGINTNISFRKAFGQNVFRFVRECTFPVITIKGKQHRKGCNNILFPMDISKETREKAGKAIEFAKYFGATIRILTLFTPSQRSMENKLIAYAHQVRKFMKEKFVPNTIKTIMTKNIIKSVMEYANKEDVDLILITNKKELSFKEYFTGTEAQKIISISTVPVLTIPPMERKDTTSFVSPF